MARLGLNPQRPLWRAYQQDPDKVERWIKREFPKIRRLAKKEKAEVYFTDEAGVRSDAHRGTTWSVRGSTPIVSTTGARFGLNLISAISPQGRMRFMVVQGTVGAETFIEFLERLVHDSDRKVFVIVDGHPAHRASKVKAHVAANQDRLRLFFLPPYSPETNPDELVWNDLKATVGRKIILGPDQMKAEVLSHMRSLQKRPDRIRSFFQAPETAYAASA